MDWYPAASYAARSRHWATQKALRACRRALAVDPSIGPNVEIQSTENRQRNLAWVVGTGESAILRFCRGEPAACPRLSD